MQVSATLIEARVNCPSDAQDIRTVFLKCCASAPHAWRASTRRLHVASPCFVNGHTFAGALVHLHGHRDAWPQWKLVPEPSSRRPGTSASACPSRLDRSFRCTNRVAGRPGQFYTSGIVDREFWNGAACQFGQRVSRSNPNEGRNDVHNVPEVCGIVNRA